MGGGGGEKLSGRTGGGGARGGRRAGAGKPRPGKDREIWGGCGGAAVPNFLSGGRLLKPGGGEPCLGGLRGTHTTYPRFTGAGTHFWGGPNPHQRALPKGTYPGKKGWAGGEKRFPPVLTGKKPGGTNLGFGLLFFVGNSRRFVGGTPPEGGGQWATEEKILGHPPTAASPGKNKPNG